MKFLHANQQFADIPSVRIPFIDFIKGASILGVVWIHIVSQVPRDAHFLWFFLATDIWWRFAVPVFFIIVGYMYIEKYSQESVRKIQQRIASLLIPFLVWSGIYIITAFFTDIDFGQTDNLGLNFFLGYASYQLYFLVAYLSFFALIPLFQRIRLAERSSWWLMGGVLVHIVLLVFWERQIIQMGEPGFLALYYWTDHRAFWNWLGFFAIGMLSARYRTLIRALFQHQRKFLLALTAMMGTAFFLVSLILVFAGREKLVYESVALYFITFSALLILAKIYLTSTYKKMLGVFEWTGRRSLSLYFVHVWLIEMLLLAIPETWLHLFWFYPVLFLMVYFLWGLLHVGLSRFRYVKWGFGI